MRHTHRRACAAGSAAAPAALGRPAPTIGASASRLAERRPPASATATAPAGRAGRRPPGRRRSPRRRAPRTRRAARGSRRSRPALDLPRQPALADPRLAGEEGEAGACRECPARSRSTDRSGSARPMIVRLEICLPSGAASAETPGCGDVSVTRSPAAARAARPSGRRSRSDPRGVSPSRGRSGRRTPGTSWPQGGTAAAGAPRRATTASPCPRLPGTGEEAVRSVRSAASRRARRRPPGGRGSRRRSAPVRHSPLSRPSGLSSSRPPWPGRPWRARSPPRRRDRAGRSGGSPA